MTATYTETLADLELRARQLHDRITNLRAERRARRGLPPRPLKLLLDSIDELEAVRLRITLILAETEGGAS